MADLRRVVAGIMCIEVLELLSDYLDDEVSRDDRERIDAHLKGCDQCERFGGQMSFVVKSLRTALREAAPLEQDVAKRLQDRLNGELGIIPE